MLDLVFLVLVTALVTVEFALLGLIDQSRAEGWVVVCAVFGLGCAHVLFIFYILIDR